jgi:hypothetical protein
VPTAFHSSANLESACKNLGCLGPLVWEEIENGQTVVNPKIFVIAKNKYFKYLFLAITHVCFDGLKKPCNLGDKTTLFPWFKNKLFGSKVVRF